MPSASPSSRSGSDAGPPRATKYACASAWVEKCPQSRSWAGADGTATTPTPTTIPSAAHVRTRRASLVIVAAHIHSVIGRRSYALDRTSVEPPPLGDAPAIYRATDTTGGLGSNARSSAWSGPTTPQEDSGTSFQTPATSPRGSDTISRALSENSRSSSRPG